MKTYILTLEDKVADAVEFVRKSSGVGLGELIRNAIVGQAHNLHLNDYANIIRQTEQGVLTEEFDPEDLVPKPVVAEELLPTELEPLPASADESQRQEIANKVPSLEDLGTIATQPEQPATTPAEAPAAPATEDAPAGQAEAQAATEAPESQPADEAKPAA